MKMDLLIVGTGRCRTAWAAAVLRASGMRITHQGIRHAHVLGDEPMPDLRADVSFEATPIARLLVVEKLILLVRDPAEVVRSWLSLGAFADTMHITHNDWWRSMQWWAPEVCDSGLSPVERATRFYIRWNYLALLASPHHIFRVENLSAQQLGEAAHPPASYDMTRYRDPGIVDDGTPGRVPVDLGPAVRESIRGCVGAYLPNEFHYAEPGS